MMKPIEVNYGCLLRDAKPQKVHDIDDNLLKVILVPNVITKFRCDGLNSPCTWRLAKMRFILVLIFVKTFRRRSVLRSIYKPSSQRVCSGKSSACTHTATPQGLRCTKPAERKIFISTAKARRICGITQRPSSHQLIIQNHFSSV